MVGWDMLKGGVRAREKFRVVDKSLLTGLTGPRGIVTSKLTLFLPLGFPSPNFPICKMEMSYLSSGLNCVPYNFHIFKS